MDRYSVCGKEFFVSDRDVTVMWPSKVAPSNPPPECIVFLTSSYSETNGRYKLQIIADSLKIKDCGVNLDLFNGRGAYGNYIVSRDKTLLEVVTRNSVIITLFRFLIFLLFIFWRGGGGNGMFVPLPTFNPTFLFST